MNLEALAGLIQQAGLGVPGQSLFVEHLPETVKQGVLLIGPSTGTRIDYEVIGYYKTNFQVIVRAPNYLAGDQLSKQIMNALTVAKHEIAPGYFVNYMRPRHEPVVYPISEGGHLEFSVNYDVCYIKS